MRRRALVTLVCLAGWVGGLALSGPAMASPVGPSGSGGGGPSALSAACDAPGGQNAGDTVSCSAIELDNASAWRGHHLGDGGASEGAPSGYGPAELQQAYNLTTASATEGRARTVAIVDAYDDPAALSDLSTYRAQWALPPICGDWITRGCVTFTKVNQDGATTPLPTPDAGWSEEISVDLDTVSATCPNCNILLVEASSATLPSLDTAEDTAAAAGPVSIGNSFGVSETSSETRDDRYFTHPGIAVTAAAGDDGYGVQWPASSPDVIAVGGTTLSPASGSSRGWSETAWSGDGSGCSAVEPQPNWQSRVGAIKAHCAQRAVADVAAVADPDTGVAVYDTFELPGWTVFGGTSVSTQIIAAVFALAVRSGDSTASGLYGASPDDFYDVTTGSNGTCGSDLCTAEVGWDAPTGLGTPDGTGAFGAGQ
jgi:subtilase family serine protease